MLLQLLEEPWVTPAGFCQGHSKGQSLWPSRAGARPSVSLKALLPGCGTAAVTLQSNVKRFIVENNQQRVPTSSYAALYDRTSSLWFLQFPVRLCRGLAALAVQVQAEQWPRAECGRPLARAPAWPSQPTEGRVGAAQPAEPRIWLPRAEGGQCKCEGPVWGRRGGGGQSTARSSLGVPAGLCLLGRLRGEGPVELLLLGVRVSSSSSSAPAAG